MGEFVSDPDSELFDDKSTPPGGLQLPPGWSENNVTRASDLNALRDAAYDLRDAVIDAATVSVTATGATTSRTQGNRAQDHLTPMDFGATGDGVADDTAELQAAVTAAMAAGVPLYLGGTSKTYRITSTIIGGSNLRIVGEGAKIDYGDIPKTYVPSGVGQAANADTIAFTALGTMGSKVLLSTDVVEKEYTATVTSAVTFAADDWVQVVAEDFYPYSSDTFVERGEIKKVRSISSNTLSFTTQNWEGYTTANTGGVRKVNFVTNLHIDGVEFIGANGDQRLVNNREISVFLYACKDFSVRNCIFRDQDQTGVAARSCILGEIHANHITGVFRYNAEESVGSVYYGVLLANNCQWVSVAFNKGETLRRLCVNSSTQTDYGQPFHCLYFANQFRDSHANTTGRVEGFEHHGFGRWITYSNNMTDSSLGGMRIEGRDLLIVNNHFINCVGDGISFDNDGKVFDNIRISNNTITRATLDGTAASGAGIIFWPPDDTLAEGAIIRNIAIDGNSISGFTGSGRHGIRILAPSDALLIPYNCVIRNNQVDSLLTTTPDSSSTGILIEGRGWDVVGNSVFGYYRGASFVDGTNGNLCRANLLRNSQVWSVSSEAGCYVAGDNIVVEGNHIEGFSSGTRIASTADATRVYRNTHITVTSYVTNAGTNTRVKGQFPIIETANFTIASDAITLDENDVTDVRIDTEAAAATDNLATITYAGGAGRIVSLRTATSTRDVTVKHGTGNIRLNGLADFTLDTGFDTLLLMWNGSNWLQIGGSNNG